MSEKSALRRVQDEATDAASAARVKEDAEWLKKAADHLSIVLQAAEKRRG